MAGLTKSTKPVREKDIKREWHLVDAKGQILGRVAPTIARLLQGKHKVTYSDYLDAGDYVVVVNAVHIEVTGRKEQTKVYTRYSGYPGGQKRYTFADLKARKPEEIIYRAVSGMLPKNKLRDQRLSRLFIFKGEEHTYKDKFPISNS